MFFNKNEHYERCNIKVKHADQSLFDWWNVLYHLKQDKREHQSIVHHQVEVTNMIQ